MDGADDSISGEGTVGEELDLERETILLGERFVDDEFHREVPCRGGAGVFVDMGGGGLRMKRIAGDGDNSVDIHLREEINIFEIFRRYDVEF
uniref:Uncharacterized protein n=1 Tax=Lotus japonicus TaxID=34305 RepID=I3SYA9_LOTJA|nr:unknown [Lotus japonicus]